MRARWLKPEFFTDKKIAELGPMAALVFEALWCIADDGGTAKGDAETLKSQMFFRWSAVGVPEITGALRHLSDSGRIRRYRIGDDEYSRIVNWTKHQQVHKPSKFRHPPESQGVAINSAGMVPDSPGNSAAPLPASPYPRHLDTYQSSSSARAKESDDSSVANGANSAPDEQWTPPSEIAQLSESALAQRLVSDSDRVCLTQLVAAAPSPLTWIAEISACLDGMPGHVHVTPEQCGIAVRDYVGNGAFRDPNLLHFRRYLERASRSPPDRQTASGGHRRTPEQPGPGERSYAKGRAGLEDIP